MNLRWHEKHSSDNHLSARQVHWVLSCLVVLVTFASPSSRTIAKPYNVVLIVADDLGYGDLSCYGATDLSTPNIDQLATNAARFTDYHSSGPMCTPSRVSLLTGKYQQSFGDTFDGPLAGDSQKHIGLPLRAVTIAERLHDFGYRSGCFGKWHLGFRAPFLPTRQGFDVFRGLTAGDGDHHTQVNRYGEADWWHEESNVSETGYTTELITRHCIDFIESNADRPFFAYVPHLAIHFPWQAPNDPPHRQVGVDYRDDKWGIIPDPSRVRPHVIGMIQAIDSSTGKILAALDRLSLRDRTIVVFTSDNGGYLSYGNRFSNISSNGILRGQKSTLYEGGHRVPLIVSKPGHVVTSTINETCHSNDLLPTLMALAGVDSDVNSDGLDLSALLTGDRVPELRQQLQRRTLFWRAGNEWAVRSNQWKLVFEENELQLYDLATDLAEANNLVNKHPKRVARLRNAWETWEQKMKRRSLSK